MVEDVPVGGWKGGRDSLGRFSYGNVPRTYNKSLISYVREIGEEVAVAVRNEDGVVVATITRLQALAQRLWSDALNSDGKTSDRLVIQARGLLIERLAPAPRDELDIRIVPEDRMPYTPRAIGFLEELDKASGGHPNTQQVLEHLRKLDPSHLLENGTDLSNGS